MAKKRQSKQSVRQSTKRREEEQRQRRRSQLMWAGIVAILLIVLAAVVIVVVRSEPDEPAALTEVDAALEESTSGAQIEPPEESTPVEIDEPVESILPDELDDPGPLAEIAPAERFAFYEQAPEMVIDPEKEYEALIRTENGDMRLRLFADEAPLTVNNFVYLARQGFYDGTVFHRVIQDFMAQDLLQRLKQADDATRHGMTSPVTDYSFSFGRVTV